MKKRIIIVAVIAVLAFSGCTEKVKDRLELTANDFITELKEADFPVDEEKIINTYKDGHEISSVEFSHNEEGVLENDIVIEVLYSADDALYYKEYHEELAKISASYEGITCEAKYNFVIVFSREFPPELKKIYEDAFAAIISGNELESYNLN